MRVCVCVCLCLCLSLHLCSAVCFQHTKILRGNVNIHYKICCWLPFKVLPSRRLLINLLCVCICAFCLDGEWMDGYIFWISCMLLASLLWVCLYDYGYKWLHRRHHSVFVPARIYLGGQWDSDLPTWRTAPDGWTSTSLSRLVLFIVWVCG